MINPFFKKVVRASCQQHPANREFCMGSSNYFMESINLHNYTDLAKMVQSIIGENWRICTNMISHVFGQQSANEILEIVSKGKFEQLTKKEMIE